MGFKLNKKNFDFGVGTGSSPNKIGTELLIGGGLEVGDKALELFEKGPNNFKNIHVRFPAAISEICQKHNVSKFIHLS